jgi:hypothetical protein
VSGTFHAGLPGMDTSNPVHEPLAVRVRARQAELARLLQETPPDERSARVDLQIALAHVDDLLTGDIEHLSDATAAALSGWLEANKHLAERG